MPSFLSLRPWAVCLAACVAVTPALAATINTTTKNAGGKPVAGVLTTLRDAAGNQVGQRTTDAQGLATFTNVPAGRYVIQSSKGTATPATQTVEVTDAPIVAVTVLMPSEVRLAPIAVIATRLKEARIALSPKIGTTVYTLDQQLVAEYGAGENTAMNDVLLRFPGVAQDSKASGSLHVRNEHANVQYRINGILLPDGLSGFGQVLETGFIGNLALITGALPAKYGLHTAALVDITTKSGAQLAGGSVSVYGGSRETFTPSFEYGGT